MKKKIFVVIISIIIILLGILICVSCSNKKVEKENNDKETKVVVNKEKDIVKDQKVDGLDMKNTSLVITDGISKLETEVINNTGSDYELKEFTIIIKDSEDKTIIELPGYVGEVIKNGETKKINSSVDIDLSNAKKVEYSVKK